MLDVAWVDTLDVCHLRCPTCLRGARLMENTSKHMSVELWRKIAARLAEDGYRRAAFFSWSEPFLHKQIHEFVAIAKASGLSAWISSTLSLPRIRHLEATLLAGLDHLTVSTSGADQATYEINHRGGRLDYVFENLVRVRDIIATHGLGTRVDIRFLRFAHNTHQAPEMGYYAKLLGFNLEEVDATPNVYDNVGHGYYDHLVRQGERAPGPTPEERGKVCGLMFGQTSIDCVGDVYLCCSVPTYPSVKIGSYLDLTADEILAKKFVHPFCRICTMPRHDPAPDEQAQLDRIAPLLDRGERPRASEPLARQVLASAFLAAAAQPGAPSAPGN